MSDKKAKLEVFQERKLGSPLKEDLTEVAKSAFSREGIPTAEDTRSHIDKGDTVVVARDGVDPFEPIGFATVVTLVNHGSLIDQHGFAVEKDAQGEGLGPILFDSATLLEAEIDLWNTPEESFVWIGGRAQTPRYLEYLACRKVSPRDEPPLERHEECIEQLAREYGVDELNGAVARGTYEQPLYSDDMLGDYEKELLEYVGDVELNLSDGDGVIGAAYTTAELILKILGDDIQESSFHFEVPDYGGSAGEDLADILHTLVEGDFTCGGEPGKSGRKSR